MARNIWDVSDILLQQRAGDIQGNMFANLGQQLGAGIQQYGHNKQMASMGVADFEAAAQANPEMLQRLEQDQNISKEAKAAYNKLKSGGVGFKDAAILSTYAKSYVSNKAQALQQQISQMQLGQFQQRQQEQARMADIFNAMGQLERPALSNLYQDQPTQSTLLDKPGMREAAKRALSSPAMQAARSIYSIAPSAVTPETLGRLVEQEMAGSKTKSGILVDEAYILDKRNKGIDVKAIPIGTDASGKTVYRVEAENTFSPSAKFTRTPQEEAEAKSLTLREESANKYLEGIISAGDVARKESRNLDQAISILEKAMKEGRTPSGVGQETLLLGKQLAKSIFGLDVGDIKDQEQLRVLFGNEVMARVGQTKGAISDREMELFTRWASNFGNSPEGNIQIMRFAKSAYDRSRHISSMVNKLRKENKSESEIQSAILDYQDANPLNIPSDPDAPANNSITSPGAAGLPSVGTIDNGYRFKGGNPNDKKNWEKI